MKISSPPSPDRPHAYVRARVTAANLGGRGWPQGTVDHVCRVCGGSEFGLPHLLHTPKRRVSLAAALAAIAAYEVPA